MIYTFLFENTEPLRQSLTSLSKLLDAALVLTDMVEVSTDDETLAGMPTVLQKKSTAKPAEKSPVRRPHNPGAHQQIAIGKAVAKRIYAPRTCEICHASYIPTGPTQRRCVDCSKSPSRQAETELDAAAKRLLDKEHFADCAWENIATGEKLTADEMQQRKRAGRLANGEVWRAIATRKYYVAEVIEDMPGVVVTKLRLKQNRNRKRNNDGRNIVGESGGDPA